MSYEPLFYIRYHLSIKNNIIMMGETKKWYFICKIKKLMEKIKKHNFTQNEGNIYILDNDGFYYNIQIRIITKSNIKKNKNEPLVKSFFRVLKLCFRDVFNILYENSSEIKIKGKDDIFSYYSYNIPSYIWCITTGMILADL